MLSHPQYPVTTACVSSGHFSGAPTFRRNFFFSLRHRNLDPRDGGRSLLGVCKPVFCTRGTCANNLAQLREPCSHTWKALAVHTHGNVREVHTITNEYMRNGFRSICTNFGAPPAGVFRAGVDPEDTEMWRMLRTDSDWQLGGLGYLLALWTRRPPVMSWR